MGLRSPSEAIQLPILEELKALKWHTLECELVTPMYGGGVDAATVDLKCQFVSVLLRATSFLVAFTCKE
jgi:hypothetical protein